MLFGLMLIPVLAVTGGAVDYGRAVAAKSRLQGIVDAAANAGARLPATANQNREKAVLRVFDANVAGTELADVKPQVKASNADTSVQATYTLETSLLGLIGIEEIDVTAKTTSRSQIENGAWCACSRSTRTRLMGCTCRASTRPRKGTAGPG